jgi:chromosome segregation ATPase
MTQHTLSFGAPPSVYTAHRAEVATEQRRVESALDDAQAQITRKQAIVDELTAQVSQLYAANDKLARKYADAQANLYRANDRLTRWDVKQAGQVI